jgi:hypothetical protein
VRKTRHWLIVSGLAVVVALGCQDQDEIRRYQVPRAAEPPIMARLLGAIFPKGDEAWVLKFSAPEAVVRSRADDFERFARTVQITDNAKEPIHWTLPDGWKREPGRDLVYAVIRMGPGPNEPSFTVSHLTGSKAASVSENVKRWAGQLGLQGLSEDDLAGYCRKIQVDGKDVVLVDMRGIDLGPMAAPTPPAKPPTEKAEAPPQWTYRAPDHWKPYRDSSPFAVAAFKAGDEGKVKITVSPLSGPAGGLLLNVKRWRGQVKLGDASDDDIRKDIREINIAGRAAQMVDLTGPSGQRIAVIIIAAGEHTWFFKMDGPAELVGREQGAFEAFVGSVKFSG